MCVRITVQNQFIKFKIKLLIRIKRIVLPFNEVNFLSCNKIFYLLFNF